MLEAVTKDLVFTVSLKCSTQNLQLSTSWAGRLHHLMEPASLPFMQTRSRTVEMPSGLSLPLAFGMNTLLIGSSW